MTQRTTHNAYDANGRLVRTANAHRRLSLRTYDYASNLAAAACGLLRSGLGLSIDVIARDRRVLSRARRSTDPSFRFARFVA